MEDPYCMLTAVCAYICAHAHTALLEHLAAYFLTGCDFHSMPSLRGANMSHQNSCFSYKIIQREISREFQQLVV